jgi:hypothetical protein
MIRLVALVGTLIALLLPASGHEMKPMGTMEPWGNFAFLHGMNREDPALTVVNCCKYGGDGDCFLYPEENVSIVPGGYQTKDGEFIPEREATVSPDEHYYRCQHAGKKSHCFFAPARGF